MDRASRPDVPTAPQFAVATRKDPRATLATVVAGKVDEIRALMHAEAAPGFNSEVASRMNWRRERISRELADVEKLSVALFLAAVEIHREQGRGEVADRLLASLNAGQPVKLKTAGAVVIRLADGQMFLDLEAPSK